MLDLFMMFSFSIDLKYFFIFVIFSKLYVFNLILRYVIKKKKCDLNKIDIRFYILFDMKKN